MKLPAAESHHLVRVLRRSPGDRVDLVASGGGIFEGEIAAVRSSGDGLQVAVRILGASAPSAAETIPWTLAVAVVKEAGLEMAVRMAGELGLQRFLPILTERTVARPGSGSGRVERWRRIAREASKQCGRATPLDLPDPLPLQRLLGEWKDAWGAGNGWILVPGPPCPPPGSWPDASAPALFLVGPEGGFTPAELARARQAGLQAMGLPTPILRTPTAAALVAALGVLSRAADGGEAGK